MLPRRSIICPRSVLHLLDAVRQLWARGAGAVAAVAAMGLMDRAAASTSGDSTPVAEAHPHAPASGVRVLTVFPSPPLLRDQGNAKGTM
jgi:methylthioribose-1-phosphate isomerase